MRNNKVGGGLLKFRQFGQFGDSSSSKRARKTEEGSLYLEYCVHHDCQWSIPRKFGDFKNIKAPFIHMLQLLKKSKPQKTMR